MMPVGARKAADGVGRCNEMAKELRSYEGRRLRRVRGEALSAEALPPYSSSWPGRGYAVSPIVLIPDFTNSANARLRHSPRR